MLPGVLPETRNRANWIRTSDAPAPKAGALHPGRLPLRLAGALRHQPLQFLRRVVREPLHVSTEIGKELDHRPTARKLFCRKAVAARV